MMKNNDSTKAAMLHAMKNVNPSAPPDPITVANESAEGAKTDFESPNTTTNPNGGGGDLPTDKLAGLKFALILNGEIIQSPRQLTVLHYDSWARKAWDWLHTFHSSPKPIMPLNWVFERALVGWIESMYRLNDPEHFD